MLLPELQRLAQSMGIIGTGRMRKGQVIAAIEERQQRGGAGNQAPGRAARGRQGAENEISVQRGAPAGAGATRPLGQDAMEFGTSTQPRLGRANAGGIRAKSPPGGAGAAG